MCTKLIATSGLVFCVVLGLAGVARAGELRNFDDAALHAIQFMDDGKEGWAVGDEGVIWHTIDGGEHWERQPSGVNASLRSLHFLNPYTGWVAGREELPGGGSGGVLLYTSNGGLNWQRREFNRLPGINVVRFADEKVGYLAGDGSDQFPSGVFTTSNSGLSWQPVPGPRCPSWLAGACIENRAVLAGAWTRLATVKADRVNMADVDALGGRNLRGLHFLGKRGVAVGQGGLLLVSDGGTGTSWTPARQLGLQLEVQEAWDFHAVHGAGRQLWVVGRPGSAVLHSKDLGETWEIQKTHQPLPLHGVFFLDEKHGWAVGELGSILATADGGKTWKVQQRGGQRVGLLFLNARPTALPVDAVALLGGQDGYLTAALRVTCPDFGSAAQHLSAEGSRLESAVRQVGGAAGEMLWHFPISSHLAGCPRADLLQTWNAMHGDAAEQLLRQLVLAMRIWRPEVLVTDNPDPKIPGSAAEVLLVEGLRVALDKAGDPKAFPEQISMLGLEPWQPLKMYGRWDDPKSATITLDLTQDCPALECSARECATPAATLLAGHEVIIPTQRCFRWLAGAPDTAHQQHLMQGTRLAHGGTAQRPLHQVPESTPEARKASQQRANLKTLSETPINKLTNPDRLLAQIGPMLADLPDDQAAPAAFAVAHQFARAGQWPLAREAFLLLADRYPTHPLAAEAYRWLIRHSSSSEARRRYELGQFLVVGEREFGVLGSGKIQVPLDAEGKTGEPGREAGKGSSHLPSGAPQPAPRVEVPEIGVRETRQEGVPVFAQMTRQWYQSSLDLETRLAAFGPLFANDPPLQFCLQASRRNLGDFEKPKQWYADFMTHQPEGPWRSAAAAELWLMNRTGPSPKPAAMCKLTETRPYLDGKLDEACWQGGPPLRMVNAAGDTVKDYPTEVRLAFDKDFLYVAVRCFHPAGEQVKPLRPRLHDADLRDHDRVSILLDLDRDYSTCFHLQVDHRGCLLEDCWGDKTWDPRWFVAIQNEARAWVVEAAIPLTALTGDSVTSGRAWAFNAIRVLPGRGVQAWSLPAEAPEEALRPEGMGLLLFQALSRQTAAVEQPQPRGK
jgi:photosystem II stability/assembly factor-like uncharacterized protein